MQRTAQGRALGDRAVMVGLPAPDSRVPSPRRGVAGQRRPEAQREPRPTGRKPGRERAPQRKAPPAWAVRGARPCHLTAPRPPPSRRLRAARHEAGAPAVTAASGTAPSRPRAPHSPRAGRRGGLDGADAQAVGRVLQGLQLLLVGLMVALHGAGGRAGGWGAEDEDAETHWRRGCSGGDWRRPRPGTARGRVKTPRARPRGRGAGITPGLRAAAGLPRPAPPPPRPSAARAVHARAFPPGSRKPRLRPARALRDPARVCPPA